MLAGWPCCFPGFWLSFASCLARLMCFSAVAARWLLYLPQACFV